MSNPSLHIVLVGGAVPGYLFPGIAVAHQLRAASRARITFLGTGKEFESRNVTTAGFNYVALPSTAMLSDPPSVWQSVCSNLTAHRAARRFFHRNRPDVVVGLGGNASAPAVRSAIALDIPTILLEPNASPCAVTRRFASQVQVVCAAFDRLGDQLDAAGPVRIVGTPVRGAFSRLFRIKERLLRSPRAFDSSHRPQLLVLAGSSTAGQMNQSVPKALYKLRDRLNGWNVVHQAGRRDLQATREVYRKLCVEAEVVPFIPDMPRVMGRSSLVISRPGGALLAELAASSVPAVLVPNSTNGQQERANAQVIAAAGAGRAVEHAAESRLDDALVPTLEDLLVDPARRLAMARQMHQLARPDAAWHIASMVLDIARTSSLVQVA